MATILSTLFQLSFAKLLAEMMAKNKKITGILMADLNRKKNFTGDMDDPDDACYSPLSLFDKVASG